MSIVLDRAVAERMAKYHSLKEHNRVASATPDNSPQSIVSQIMFNPQNNLVITEDVEAENFSQQEFCTQAIPAVPLLWPGKPPKPPTLRPDPDLAHLLMTGLTTAAPEPAAPDVSNQSSELLPHVHENEGEPEKSSPIEVVELGFHDSVSSKQIETLKDDQITRTLPSLVSSSHLPPVTRAATPDQSFYRWRQHMQGGKYLQRHLAKIPRDQEEFLKSLLDTGDSWQPSLIGQPQRPGEVPLALLKQFCNAADSEAAHPATLESQVQTTTAARDRPSTPLAQDGGIAEQNPDDEDDSEAAVSWAKSPTQRQQRKFSPSKSVRSSPSDEDGSQDISSSPPITCNSPAALPPSSPPVDLARQSQYVPSPRTPDKQDTVRRSPGDSLHHIEGNQEEAENTLESVELGPPSHVSPMNPQSTSFTETPRSTRSSRLMMDDEPVRAVPKPATSSQVIRDTSARKIQVKNTPYLSKDVNLLPRQSREPSDMLEPRSSFVPATYTSSFDAAAGSRMRAATRSPVVTKPYHSSRATTSCSGILTGMNPRSRLGKILQRDKSSKPSREGNLKSRSRGISSSQGTGEARRTPNVLRRTENEREGDRQLHVSESGRNKATTTTVQLEDRTGEPHELHFSASAATSLKPADVEGGDTTSKKRERDGAGTNIQQSKRLRPNPQAMTFDSDLVAVQEKRLADRREVMRAIGKPKNLVHPASSSSVMGADSSSGQREAPSSRSKQPSLPQATINAVQQSSTPITRQSTYSGAWNVHSKARPGDGVSLLSPAPVTNEQDEHLFARYQAAYPDYEGTLENFDQSCSFIQGVLNSEPNKIHSSLLDDAIFHHFHSYQPYTDRTGSTAMSFVKYFNECVDDPSHHMRVVKTNGLERRGRRIQSESFASHSLIRGPQLPPVARSISETVAHPTPSKGEIEQARRAFLARKASKPEPQAISNANLSQESIESIERWRENAAARGSPELGSSDIDRRGLEKPDREEPVAVAPSPSSLRHNSSRPARQAHSPMLAQSPKPAAPLTRDRVLITTEPQKHPPPTQTSYKKPQSLAAKATAAPPIITLPIASSSQVSAMLAPQRLVGTNTAFTEFSRKNAPLYQTQKENRALARDAKAAGRDGEALGGTGINIFTWRSGKY